MEVIKFILDILVIISFVDYLIISYQDRKELKKHRDYKRRLNR